MSYQSDRETFIMRMTLEKLPLDVTLALLRAATTLQRYAELACSSEAADNDRVPCPASTMFSKQSRRHPEQVRVVGRRATGPCVCDRPNDGHETVPRITVQADRLERRLAALLVNLPRQYREPEILPQWAINTQGDPRGYVLSVIPPSYAERNQGRDQHNLDTIGVPSGPTRLGF